MSFQLEILCVLSRARRKNCELLGASHVDCAQAEHVLPAMPEGTALSSDMVSRKVVFVNIC